MAELGERLARLSECEEDFSQRNFDLPAQSDELQARWVTMYGQFTSLQCVRTMTGLTNLPVLGAVFTTNGHARSDFRVR